MPEISARLLINTFLILGALFAFLKGGPAERAAATIVVANVMIGQVGHWVAPDSGPVIRLFNDGVSAMALMAVTIRYAAPWMGGVMLFFAAQFAMHSYYMVLDLPNDRLHAIINNIDWSGIAWCLIIGTAVSWRQRARRARAAAAAA